MRDGTPVFEGTLAEIEGAGIGPEQAIHIGDWPERDMVGAKKAGIRTAFARYGDTFGTKDSGADYEVNDIYELVEIVDRLHGAD